ncbi:MAG: methyltransferase domain-containing protein [Euryarchaeota archaeon]|nr:methyltransferase domain-containing protein [Euryarchaeota archaeon]
MKIDEYFCLHLNNFFPKKTVAGEGSPQSHSEIEYEWAKGNLELHSSYIDLKDKIIMDAGCGLGGKTVFYAENGCKSVVGIDMDDRHIKYADDFAKQRGALNTEFMVGSLDSLPFESNKFDIVFLSDVIEHIRRPILIKALEECKRVVKTNGRICLEFPPWTSNDAAHLYNYIYIPWCQVVFSPETLINVTKKMNPKPRHGGLSVIEHFQELNHITIKEFKDIIRELDFKVINFETLMIKNIKTLRYIPFFNRYLTSRVVAVLSK